MIKEVTAYIAEAPSEQQKIMLAIRALIHKSLPDITEEYKWSRPIFKTTKPLAYLQANKSNVNLGFYEGFEKLRDPRGLLEGSGKTMRHIKLHKAEDVDSELLKEWLSVLSRE